MTEVYRRSLRYWIRHQHRAKRYKFYLFRKKWFAMAARKIAEIIEYNAAMKKNGLKQ